MAKPIFVNIWIQSKNRGKVVIAVPFTEDKQQWKIYSNSSLIVEEPNWVQSTERPGFKELIVNRAELTFF